MKTTRVYITCDTPDLVGLKRAAELIANQKCSEPAKVPWPRYPENGQEGAKSRFDRDIEFCKDVFRKEIVYCDLFVAIVGDSYGESLVPHPANALVGGNISRMHFEILQALEAHDSSDPADRRPLLMICARDVDRDDRVESMLEEIPEKYRRGFRFESDQQFKKLFSEKLVEFRQSSLARYLRELTRYKMIIVCKDAPGLLANVAEVVNGLGGNVAGGNQVTVSSFDGGSRNSDRLSGGSYAILQFVAEWAAGSHPSPVALETSLEEAFAYMYPSSSNEQAEDTGLRVNVIPVESDESEFGTLFTFIITFVDQPGIAEDVFSTISGDGKSVINTQVDTFLSGGIMLGRIQFSISGDGFDPGAQSIFEDRLRKLPGILHVDSTALRGRFWR